VVNQRTSTQFDVIWVSAKKKNAFAVKDHKAPFQESLRGRSPREGVGPRRGAERRCNLPVK
jgi:hypothetical protein